MEFTVKIKGLNLPENTASEFSKALNRYALNKIAELDLAKGKPLPSSVYAIKDEKNGGEIYPISLKLYKGMLEEIPFLKDGFSVINRL